VDMIDSFGKIDKITPVFLQKISERYSIPPLKDSAVVTVDASSLSGFTFIESMMRDICASVGVPIDSVMMMLSFIYAF